MSNTNVANRLKQAMERAELSQTELASKTTISKATISRYLSGEFKPKPKTLNIIAATLNVSAAWLAGYDVPMERESTNKNDDLSRIIARLRRDNDFYAACIALYEMNADQLRSVRDLIAAFNK